MFLNPAMMYAATWFSVLLLYSFGLSDLLEPLRVSTIVLVVGTSASFILGWLLESIQFHGRLATAHFNLQALGAVINSRRVGRRVTIIWIIFILGISFEVASFGGVPLLGLLGIGGSIQYSEFGFHGFHGVVNALFYAGCVITFARVLLGSSRRKFILGVVSCAYPALVMSRQVLISLALQYLLVYFSVKRPSPRIFVRAGVLFIATFLLFGYLGDLRTGRDSIISAAAPTFDYPTWLPSAFIWFYIYMCSPLNNVNYNIDVTPSYFPMETAQSLVPSFARDAFTDALGGRRQWDLVSETFNVNSLLQSFLVDFGVAGAIVFTLLCGAALSRLLRRARTSPAAFFASIVMLHGIALSFFANLLFELVFMFEIAAISWAMARGRRR
jgi:oligosaccharide repeat unit polymerase